MCPSPVLDAVQGATPAACSGKGACQADGTCACDLGAGDVGCSVRTPVLAWAATEQHTLSSNDWIYWELDVPQDAAALMVEMNRTSGDPVLFLKPKGLGFQVCKPSSRDGTLSVPSRNPLQPGW